MTSKQNKAELTFKEFENFFRTNYHAASLVAFRYVNDPNIVEDILQESFIKIWEKHTEIYTGQEDLKRYLLVTVRNKTISYLRNIKINQVELKDTLPEIDFSDDEKLFEEEELAIRVNKAIQELPPKCRKIFQFAYQESLSYNQIANKLSISKNTVKTQMVIAYRILRKELKEFYLGFLFLLSKRQIN